YRYEPGGKVGSHGAIPPEVADQAQAVRDSLVEGIVVADDDLMERYLEGESLEPKELREALAKGVNDGTVFPVATGSATKLIGIHRLASLIAEVGPSPLDRPPVSVQAGGTTTDVKAEPGGQPLAIVYRTLADAYVGKVSFFKALSGTIRPDAQLTNPRTHT